MNNRSKKSYQDRAWKYTQKQEILKSDKDFLLGSIKLYKQEKNNHVIICHK